MKVNYSMWLFALLWIGSSLDVLHGQSVAINDDGSTAHSSAMLDIKVNSNARKGILIPRMSSVDRNAITSPAKGLLVYDSTTNSFWFHNGSDWTNIAASSTNFWEPNGTTISNTNPGNVGIGVSVPRAKLHIGRNQMVLFGDKTYSTGKKLLWNGIKGAFRAGWVNDVYENGKPYYWDDELVGVASFAAGESTLASGIASFAGGSFTRAEGDGSTAFGWQTRAVGRASFVTGLFSYAEGQTAVALGQSYAFGEISFAANVGTANGDGSAAFNNGHSKGEGSFAAGFYTIAETPYTMAVGVRNKPLKEFGNGRSPTTPVFIIGNGDFDNIYDDTYRKNAFVVLRNAITSINKDPDTSAMNDGMLQVKALGLRHALTLEEASQNNKWSFVVDSDLELFFNNSFRGSFNRFTGEYSPVGGIPLLNLQSQQEEIDVLKDAIKLLTERLNQQVTSIEKLTNENMDLKKRMEKQEERLKN